MTEQTIAVTGATGRLGGRVAARLAAAGVPQTLVVRDPARAPRLPQATVLPGAFGDPDAVRRALRGVDRVLMVSASETPDRVDQHRSFVDAAAEAGVAHLTYISFYGARPDATFTLVRDHAATEAHIRASGMAWTFLRDNLYADFFTALVGDDGVIRGPAADGRVAAVAQDDVAGRPAAQARLLLLMAAPAVAGRPSRVAAGMAEIPEGRVAGRAVPLPEEQAVQREGDDRRGAAEEILRDSEQRVAEAAQADAPRDAADEHRRSEDTVGP
jgi:uncharacterized protein YbjT (DUF2867 family)